MEYEYWVEAARKAAEIIALAKETTGCTVPRKLVVLDRDESRRWIEQRAKLRKELMVWDDGVDIDALMDAVFEDGEPTTRKPRTTHISTGPGRTGSQKDGRGNRTGRKIRRKLTATEAGQIKWLCFNTDRANMDIANEFGVSRETVSHVRHGRRWGWV